MSVETLNTLKQQAEVLSASEKSNLANYLLDRIRSEKQTEHAADEATRRKRQEWIRKNRQKYGGMYVALDGDALIGTGANYAEAFESAKKAGISNAFVDFVAPLDYTGEIGGFE